MYWVVFDQSNYCMMFITFFNTKIRWKKRVFFSLKIPKPLGSDDENNEDTTMTDDFDADHDVLPADLPYEQIGDPNRLCGLFAVQLQQMLRKIER